MCVIIHKEPNVEIPFEKLKSACLVNADGFGLVVPDRGKLDITRYYDHKGNDPDKLARLLENAKDKDVFVHLRFKTKGAVDIRNVHPFTVSTRKSAGIDVQFMHNGTLSDFGNQADCDSKVFSKEVIAPLYRAILDQVGEEKALTSPLFNRILKKYAGGTSVFLLTDGLGNHTIVNKDNGFQFDGWWASNEYSFNRAHRTPITTFHKQTYNYGPYKHQKSVDTTVVKEDTDLPFFQSLSSPSKVITLDDILPSVTGTSNLKSIVSNNKKFEKDVSYERQSFCEAAEVQSLDDITLLSPNDIEDLVDKFPEHTCLLIMDLISELYGRRYSAEEWSCYDA
jgi:predicted glutamine amidotransferase